MEKIKKIIFDIDNTLIYWKTEYVEALAKSLKKFNIKIETSKVDDVIENLENMFYILSKDKLLEAVNTKYKININIDFINYFFEEQKKLATVDYELIDVLEYLSQKYELIIYTNYFHEVQEGRLKTAKIDNYFSKIYGGDDIPLKPNKEGFDIIIGDNDKSEYVMIGDSINMDIIGAKNAGIKAILFDYKNAINDKREYLVIKNMKELKELF